MKVLVVGSGGREHSLCWKLRQSPELEELYCAPGNPGIGDVADRVPIAADEITRLADFAQEMKIDLTVVGPELSLVLGIVDEFQRRELRIFGPRQQAAELEGSKAFSKEFMARHGIPTADFEIVHDRAEAEKACRRFGFPVVLKADGLAAGKGVLVPQDARELRDALDVFFEEKRFGAAGVRVVVERFLVGEEVSFLALSDGERALPFATVRDYKRLEDDDRGPNTGGMGAHSPSGLLPREIGQEIMAGVVHPTIEGMAEENRTFRGILYAGLMMTAEGPRVLEFNVRFGDPECQALLLRLEDDLLPLLATAASGELGMTRLRFRKEVAAVVVLASRGYPDSPVKGEPVSGLEEAAAIPGVTVFHAGTAFGDDGRVVASGGRVINVCGTGASLGDALRRAYAGSKAIDWPSKQFRRDIGRKLLLGEVTPTESGMFRLDQLSPRSTDGPE